MRISDWSSDVCSSDLRPVRLYLFDRDAYRGRRRRGAAQPDRRARARPARRNAHGQGCAVRGAEGLSPVVRSARWRPPTKRGGVQAARRSEEHTSELQSLMRTSYAVFCLKKNHRGTETQYTTDERRI